MVSSKTENDTMGEKTPKERSVPFPILTFAILLIFSFTDLTQSSNEEISSVIAQSALPIRLQEVPVWVQLNKTADTKESLTPDMLNQWIVNRKLTLILKDLSADAQPASPYSVYFGLSSSARPEKDGPNYVGRFWLYSEINMNELKATPTLRSFDITYLAKRLFEAHTMANPIGVMIVPERSPSKNTNFTIGSILLVAQ